MTALWEIVVGVQWILLLLLAVLVAGILRYLGSLQESFHAGRPAVSRYSPGDQIPDVHLLNEQETQITLHGIIGTGRNALLLFVHPGCQGCVIALTQLQELAGRVGDLRQAGWCIAVLVGSRRDEFHQFAQEHSALASMDGVDFLFDPEGATARQFGVAAVPAGMAIDGTGRLVSQSLNPHANWIYEVTGLPEPEESVLATWGKPVPFLVSPGEENTFREMVNTRTRRTS